MPLDREIHQELQKNISAKIGAFHVFQLLTTVLDAASNQGKPRSKEAMREDVEKLETKAQECADEIISLIVNTIEAGKIPTKQEAA